MGNVCEIVGIRNVNYMSKKNNRQVTGLEFYLVFPQHDVIGLASDNVFVSSSSATYADSLLLKVGDKINVFYNRFGSVEGLQLVQPAPAPEAAKK